jgi:HAMP domain-containing protein
MPEFMLQQNAPVSAEQLKQQIQQSVRDAQIAAEQAAKAAAQSRNGPHTVVIGPDVPVPPGIPTTQVAFNPGEMIPPQAEAIAISFFVMIAAIVIGLPVMRAWARRIERGTPTATIPTEMRDQLRQLSQSVDAIAIEVERISEGQRFTTKMLSDRTAEKQAG